MEGLAKNLSLSWTGDFDSLKTFFKEILKLDGEWTQPKYSKMQASNISYHESIRENPKSLAPNLNQHRNSSNSDCIIVQNQLPLSTANTNVTDNNEQVVDSSIIPLDGERK